MVRAKTITGHEICILVDDDDNFDLCIIPAPGTTELEASVEFATELKSAISEGTLPQQIRKGAEAIIECYLGSGSDVVINFEDCSEILSAVDAR